MMKKLKATKRTDDEAMQKRFEEVRPIDLPPEIALWWI